MNYRSTQQVILVSNSILPPHADYRSTKNDHGNCRVYECMQVGMSRDQSWYIERLVEKYRELGIEPEDIAVLHPWRQSRNGLEGIYPIANALESKGMDYTLDKHPLYDRRMILIKWLEDLAYWCLVGWDPMLFEGKRRRRVIFEDLLRIWEQITHGQIFEGEHDSETRSSLTRVLWELRSQDQLLGEWLGTISKALNLGNALVQYARMYPDEVNEYNRLLGLTQAGSELDNLTLSRFANLLPGVQLTTIHSSKGMEFEIVIIAGVERIWVDDEGRRLLYVAVTRAKREVCILYTKVWPEWDPQPSPYINELVTKCGNWECFAHYPL
jgi:DNA helicase-2/ATP-dependent DNA helicase PcrA